MHLTIRDNNGIRYLLLLDTEYAKGKTCRKKVVKNLGRYEDLPKEIQAIYEDPHQRPLLARAAETQYRLELAQNPVKTQTPMTREDKRRAWATFAQAVLAAFREGSKTQAEAVAGNVFNEAVPLRFGHLMLRDIWNSDLGLAYKINYLQKSKTELTGWNLNDLIFYLCSVKLMDPQSYYSACGYKSNFLYCPWNNITQDNFYRGLDFVYQHREGILEHAVKRHHHNKADIKLAFFDCTNAWFETPYDDVIWQMRRFSQKVFKELAKKRFTAEQIEAYFESEEYAKRLDEELENRSHEAIRMRGKSKEGRCAQPIVTVALAIDQTGFPIDCKVFAGNMSETKTIQPVLDSLKDKYSIQDVYFVADRGLNSTATLNELQTRKLGCVVAQKVSMQKPEVRAQMLALAGYRRCRIRPDGSFATLPGEVVPNEFRYKVCDFVKESRIPIPGEKTPSGRDRTRKVSVPCRIIYTFSPERQARDLAELDNQIARASKAVEDGMLVGNPSSTGWRGLIKTKKEMAQKEADKELYRACGLKEEVIAERKETAGYAAMVYMHPTTETFSPEDKLTDEQILSTYHQLVSIEDCFRVMKSNFSIRPMHVRLHQRITAHCYLCVISLMMLKVLQEKLAANNVSITPERICRALNDATVIPVAGKSGIRGFIRAGGAIRFHTQQRTGKQGRDQSDLNETVDSKEVWRKYKQDRIQNRSDIDQVMAAAGFEPLPYFTTMGQIKSHFRLNNLPNDKVVAYEIEQYVRELAHVPMN